MRSRSAFTLVELLVVIAIIGVLIVLLLPAVQAARAAPRRTSCINNMRQLGLGLHSHHDAKKALPSGWVAYQPDTKIPNVEGAPGWGWASAILDYLEAGNVSQNLIDFNLPTTHPLNAGALRQSLPIFRCPSDVTEGDSFELREEGSDVVLARLPVANYVAMFGTGELEECEGLPLGEKCLSNGAFGHLSSTSFRQITDGLSHTIFVGERASRLGESTWIGIVPEGEETFARVLGIADHAPNHDQDAHLDDYRSEHPGGTHFLMGDGSVRFLSDEVDVTLVYKPLSTVAGGEIVGSE